MKSPIDDIIKEFLLALKFAEDKDGTTVDSSSILTTENYLHQDTEEMTEKESAKNEADDPGKFKVLVDLDKQIQGLF
jgi:hypothetical protein